MNQLVGEKLSIVSSKAQTTRHRILGIVNEEDYQIVFSDTPGVVKSMSWGNRIERVCTWAYFEDREGPAFYLYNVHLDHESQLLRLFVELLRG